MRPLQNSSSSRTCAISCEPRTDEEGVLGQSTLTRTDEGAAEIAQVQQERGLVMVSMTLFDFDVAIFRWLNSWVGISFFWDWVIIFRAVYAWHIMAAAAAAFAAAALLPRFRPWRRANIRLLILAAVSALFSRFVMTESIRFFFNRPRPFEALPDVIQLIPHAGGASFPSGHAALAFAIAAAVSFYYPKTSILFFLAALSIGASRVAVGVHWPSDIIAGAAVGFFSAWVVRRIEERLVSSARR